MYKKLLFLCSISGINILAMNPGSNKQLIFIKAEKVQINGFLEKSNYFEFYKAKSFQNCEKFECYLFIKGQNIAECLFEISNQDKIAYISSLKIPDKNNRCQGYGHVFLQSVLKILREKKCPLVTLTAEPMELDREKKKQLLPRLCAFYQKNGFENNGSGSSIFTSQPMICFLQERKKDSELRARL